MDEFEEIYLAYFQDVYRYLRRVTSNAALAEELTEETFFKAMLGLNKFNGKCDIRVWLCQIGKNLYRNHLKKQKRMTEQDLEEVQVPAEVDLERDLLDRESAKVIYQLLHELKSSSVVPGGHAKPGKQKLGEGAYRRV